MSLMGNCNVNCHACPNIYWYLYNRSKRHRQNVLTHYMASQNIGEKVQISANNKTSSVSFEKWTNKTSSSLTRPAGFQFPLHSNIYIRDCRERGKTGFLQSVFPPASLQHRCNGLLKWTDLRESKLESFRIESAVKKPKALGAAAVVGSCRASERRWVAHERFLPKRGKPWRRYWECLATTEVV